MQQRTQYPSYLVLMIAQLWLLPNGTFAQHVDDNAITQAGDVFGYTVADQTVGVYSSNNVRGFDPSVAGNLRVDGLYVDGIFANAHLFRSQAIRVGLSALDFPFRAPSGIVDDQLVRADGKNFTSVSISDSNYTSAFSRLWSGGASVDFAHLDADGFFGAAGGADIGQQVNANGGYSRYENLALIPTFRLSPLWTATIVLGYTDISRQDLPPEYFLGNSVGQTLPPKIMRLRSVLQPWDTTRQAGGVFGTLLEGTAPGGWHVKMGVFYGYFRQSGLLELISGITPDGLASNVDFVQLNPHTHAKEVSGEWRAVHSFRRGPVETTLVINTRGRSSLAEYGNNGFASYPYVGSVNDPFATQRPTFANSSPDHDRVDQISTGASLRSAFENVGLFNIDLEHTSFTKTFTPAGGALERGVYNRWLYGIELGVIVTKNLTAYGAYTRGLEDSGTAPNTAYNADQVLPASITQQYELGFRLKAHNGYNLLIGVFSLTRPYPALDVNNVYHFVGTLRNRGIEISLDASITKQLHVLFGGYVLSPKIDSVSSEVTGIGNRPIGVPTRDLQLNIDYGLAFLDGLSLNTTIENFGARSANISSTSSVPSRTAVSVGAVWRFTAYKNRTDVRFNIANLTDNYGWSVNSDGSFAFNAPRYLTLSARMDF